LITAGLYAQSAAPLLHDHQREGNMAISAIVDASEDWPAAPQPIKFWSESYAFWAWDEANELTLYAHFQRHPDKPAIWRGYATVLRPDEVYAFHSYGDQRSRFGPGFESCSITVERPHELWRLRVASAAARQTQAEHEVRCITDGPAVPILIDVQLSLKTPVWSLPHGSKEAESVMPAHYEQTGIVTGVVELGDRRFIINCPGANDHSRGVRDTSQLKTGGFFFNAVFPDGRSLTAIKMAADTTAGDLGYVCNGDGRIRQVDRVVAPKDGWPMVGKKTSFTVEAEDIVAVIEVEPSVRRVMLTMIPPNYEHVGLIEGYRTPLYYCDWTCRMSWDGQPGWGSWEVAQRGAER
jgi:hypothetical protein